eukprot:jgi/Tetstr1/464327/TSEL_009128.t1
MESTDYGGIFSVSWSPDGHSLASGTEQGPVLVWRMNADQEVGSSSPQMGAHGELDSSSPQVLAGHSDWVYSAAWSPDGRSLAFASEANTVLVWKIGAGGELDSSSPMMGAYGELDKSSPQVLAGHSGWVTSVAWSPGGRFLASGSWNCTVLVWQLSGDGEMDGNRPKVLAGHTGTCWSVAWSPDGRSLATASSDSNVLVWRRGTDGELDISHTLELGGHSGWVLSMAWSPDGRSFASAHDDNTVLVWSMGADGELESSSPRVLDGHSDLVYAVAWSPDGRLLASGSGDGTVLVRRAGADGELDSSSPQVVTGYNAQVNGQRCPYRSGNGLPYCKRHSNHGLPMLAHDDDGGISHWHSYMCFGCGQPSDDHPTDSEEADGVHTFNCTTRDASIAAACAAKALGADLLSDAKVIRGCCSGVRDRWGLILTDAVTEVGEPAVPQYYRVPVQPDLLPSTITARSTGRLNTPRGERAPARGLADGITPARLPLAAPATRTPTPAPATARAAAPRPRVPAAYEPATPPAPFTLTSADCNKLVEAVAALTGKVEQVVK